MEPYYRNNYNGYTNRFSSAEFNNDINPNIMKTPQNLNSNYLRNSDNKINHNFNSNNHLRKNISEITKLNYNTENQNLNILNQNNNQIIKLDHKFIESTTEDSEHPLRELVKGLNGAGWFSSRFSQFPQEIYIQFTQPVFLKQINMVIHEKNIPAQIKFYTYFPENNNEIIGNYHNVKY